MNTTNATVIPLAEVLDMALAAGLLVHQSGGDTARTIHTIRRVALALGAERAESIVSSVNIGLTLERGAEQITAFRKAPHMGANFTLLSSVEQVVQALEKGRLGAIGLRMLFADFNAHPHSYPKWLIALTVGVSCGGFSALFGGSGIAVLLTMLGASTGMALRLWLYARQYKPFMFALASSFVALLMTGLLIHLVHIGWLGSSLSVDKDSRDAALAASVLFLIPGVPLLNGAADLLGANYLNGLVRLTMSIVFVIGIGVGVSLALRILTLIGVV